MLGINLRKLRTERGLTQSYMADILGINSRSYQNYEAEMREPEFATVCKLADFFGVSVDYLLGRNECVIEAERTSPVPEVQKLFDKLDENEQAAVIQMMKTLIKGKK